MARKRMMILRHNSDGAHSVVRSAISEVIKNVSGVSSPAGEEVFIVGQHFGLQEGSKLREIGLNFLNVIRFGGVVKEIGI